MQVRVGTSFELADTSWRKSDVTLDEIDLQRLFVEAELAPDTVVSTQKAFQILEAEAQRLLLAQLISRFTIVMKTPENIAQLQAYKGLRDDLLNSLKDES